MLATLLFSASFVSFETSVEIPTKYRADRFLVEVPLATGKRPLLLADTGGGMLIFRDAAKAAGVEPAESEYAPGRKSLMVALPPMEEGTGFPLWPYVGGKLFVTDRKGDLPLQDDEGGILGMAWFMTRAWTFDYPAKKLTFLSGEVSKPEKAMEEPLGPNPAQPRVMAEIDGHKIVCLFDSGASTRLTQTALAAIKDGEPAVRATSFMGAKHFDRWRKDHTDWSYIEDGERNFGQPFPMIRVPKVKIAGYEVGPAWFVRRDDESFRIISNKVEPPLEGAIGGNVLRSFRITLDYSKGVLYYEKP